MAQLFFYSFFASFLPFCFCSYFDKGRYRLSPSRTEKSPKSSIFMSLIGIHRSPEISSIAFIAVLLSTVHSKKRSIVWHTMPEYGYLLGCEKR